MVLHDSYPPWAAYTTMTFDLAFDLQDPIEGQKDGVPDIVPKLRLHVHQIRSL